MAQRQEILNSLQLQSLFVRNPYLGILQKENWQEYIELIAKVYDHIESAGGHTPFEGVKMIALKHFRDQDIQFVDSKVSQFLIMCMEELKVLKDFHDNSGRRMVELTRSGNQLLQLIEGLVAQKTKYSGTGAETLLVTLNEILLHNQGFDKTAAEAHHMDKINSYKDDLKRIQNKGIQFAELLPVPHSAEALFAQAEGAAIDILAAVEDVKQAIEKERVQLAQSYMDGKFSSGQTVNAVAQFYEQLHNSEVYKSYNQAKNIFSFLETKGPRFQEKDVPKILDKIKNKKYLDSDILTRSSLNSFKRQFEMADSLIQEKIRSQLNLLQLQVRYSLSTDIKGLQNSLKKILQYIYKNKSAVSSFLSENPIEIKESDMAYIGVDLCSFDIADNIENKLVVESFAESEKLQMIEALLKAEEATLKQIIYEFENNLAVQKQIESDKYDYKHGLLEYYVLSEIELFSKKIIKQKLNNIDLNLKIKNGSIVIRNANCYLFQLKDKDNARGLE